MDTRSSSTFVAPKDRGAAHPVDPSFERSSTLLIQLGHIPARSRQRCPLIDNGLGLNRFKVSLDF